MESSKEIIQRLLRDRKARIHAVRRSHHLFFSVYFGDRYATLESPPFHREIFSITEDTTKPIAVILAFRGSGKSTIVSFSYVLWAIMGIQKVKFVLLVGLTQEQSRQMLRNIRSEIESNPRLASDLGPFLQEMDEWRNSSLVFPSLGAKIMAVSVGQSVRGLKHGPDRPGLIICDDIEDMESTRTREGREKTRQWVMGELLPAGAINMRAIFIGNLLHRDALIPRLQQDIESGLIGGISRAYPLLDREKNCLWPKKYPSPESIEEQFRRIGGDRVAWHREYLLEFIDEGGQIISPAWIKYYDQEPSDTKLVDVVVSIDLAISQNDTADFTAMVAAKVYQEEGKRYIYIQPHPINARLTHLETVDTAKQLAAMVGTKRRARIIVEEVGYQGALVEVLKDSGCAAEGFKVHNQDKKARLALGSHLIQSGQVLFPRLGCEDLITQLLDFGIERYDDLVDSLSMLLLSIRMKSTGGFYGAVIDLDDDGDRYMIRGIRLPRF